MSNRFGGKKHKRYGRKKMIDKKEDEMPIKEDNMLYAQVIKRIGGKRVLVMCDDKVERHAIIPGSMYKRVWLNPGDIILVMLEPIMQGDCTVVYKYNESQSKTLQIEKLVNFDELSGENDGIIFGEEEEINSEDNIFNQDDDISKEKIDFDTL